MAEIKQAYLDKSNVLSITGAAYADWNEQQQAIVPVWKRGMSNATTSSGSGEYDGGDRVIGFGAYAVDGDLLLTVGWGDGAAIRRINNDGTMTLLWHETYALYRDDTSTYNHAGSLAIHKASSTMCIMSYNVNGYSMIDYSDIKDSSTNTNNVVNDRPTHERPDHIFRNGAAVDRAGSSHFTGLVTAGDWLYIADHNASHYRKYPRRHWTNGTEELIDGNDSNYIWTDGTNTAASVDRSGYRSFLRYDEVNDRVYNFAYYNANFTVILDASTANPKVLWCDLGDAGVGDDAYEQGLFVPDPVNYPNKVKVGGNGRFLHVDISPCFSGSTPTIIDQIYVESNDLGDWNPSCQQRGGVCRQSVTSEWTDKMPGYPDFMPSSADRARNTIGGWFDWDNLRHVGIVNQSGILEDTTTGGRGRSYRSDYTNPLFRMQSADGTYWWVQTGYGGDGHSFKIWSNSVGPGLVGNWEVEFGTLTLDNNNAISFCFVTTEGHQTPGGCSLSIFVSNNNGTTWEEYSGDTHEFSSTGTQLRVKYVATGFVDKAPYKMGTIRDQVLYGAMYTGFQDADIPTKITRRKIRGRRT